MARRDETFQADGGVCVNCGARLPRGGDWWSWQSHHCVPEQALRAEGAPSKYMRTALVCILLCRRCHERHTSRTATIPFERIPLRVRVAAQALGEWAVARLEREHPPAAGRLPA